MPRRRVPSDFLLVTGLMLLVVAGSLWVLRDTLVATDRIVARSDEILAEQPVRDTLAVRLAEVLRPATPETPLAELERAQAIADEAVLTEPFAVAFERTLREIHGHVLEGDTTPVVMDETLVTEGVRRAGYTITTRIAVTVDPEVLPDLSRSSRAAGTAIPLLALAGLFLVVAALVTTGRRPVLLTRIGRWLLVSGLGAIVVVRLVPVAVLRPSGGWLGVAGIVVQTGDGVVLPAACLSLAGVATMLLGHHLATRGRRRALAVIPRHPGRHVEGWQSPV
ncbi:MAG: hypothetical protein FJW88_03235 [Actinobacteria bacterium]|nr:hypothetical protein [Actinomycetota bacterium]